MSGNQNAELVRRMYECFNRGDMDTIRNEIFAPDLQWNLPGRNMVAGNFSGVDEVLSFFGKLVSMNVQVDLNDVLSNDEYAVDLHVGRGEFRGRDLNARTVTVYRIRDGKIAEVQVHPSDQYQLDDFFAPEDLGRDKKTLVRKAYDALASGNRDIIRRYWADDMVWHVPGRNQLSGDYNSLDKFMGFMGRVNELSGGTFRMRLLDVMVSVERTTDLQLVHGQRNGKTLDIMVIHLLRWRDGKIAEGWGLIAGDGTNRYDEFWGQA